MLGVELAFVGDPFGERVVLGAVFGGVVADALGDVEAVALPVEAALDEPGEDCCLFGGVGAEGAFEVGVALGGGDDLRERDLEDAPPERVVVGVRARAGVRDEPERELRLELEVLRCRNRAAILSPPVSCLISPSARRLPSSTSTLTTMRAPASRAMSLRMPASPRRCEERLEVGGGGVVAERGLDRFDGRGLAGRAWAVQEREDLLVGDAGDGVAGEALHERAELVVGSRDAP